jgi:hypothetical protein
MKHKIMEAMRVREDRRELSGRVVLSAQARQGVLDQAGQLRKGLVLGGSKMEKPT